MKPHWLFPAGFLVGAAIVWAFLRPGCVDPADESLLRASRQAPSPIVVSESEEDASATALTDPIPEDLERPDGARKRIARFHTSLATAYALTNRLPGFLEHTGLAMKAGARTSGIQKLVFQFPQRSRVAVHEALAKRHPSIEWSRTDLATHCANAGDRARAFAIVLEEIEKDPKSPTSLIKRLVKLDPIRAASHLRDLSGTKEWGAGTIYVIARALVQADRGDLAQTFLVDTLMKAPLHSDALTLLAKIDPEKALGFASEATRRSPENASAWGTLAGLRLETGDRAGALDAFHLAAKHASPDKRTVWLRSMLRIDAKAALAPIRALTSPKSEDSLRLLGQALIWNGLRSEAFDAFARALAVNRTSVGSLHQLVTADPARAIDHLAQTLASFSGSKDRDEILGAQALALLDLGQTDRAYAVFLEASNLDNDDYEWLRGLAASDPIRAAQHLETRLVDKPDSGNLAGALGDAYAKLGRKADAGRLYDEAISSGNSLRWKAAMVRADPKRGLDMLKETLRRRPGNDEAWGALGDAYRDLGRLGEARDAYSRALELDPDDWEWDIKRDQIR